MKTAILTIGTELLIGQTIDTNSAWIGSQLYDIGVDLVKSVSIADENQTIIDTIAELSPTVDYIFITGGLGPTKDDITKTSIASFLGVDQYFDESQYQRIGEFFTRINRPLSPLHRDQCYFPKGVEFLENALGTAPGMLFRTPHANIISMPGVPYEMKSIFTTGVLPLLKTEYQGPTFERTTIHTAGVPESTIADRIQPVVDTMPPNMNIAYLPTLGTVKVRVGASGANAKSLVKTYVDRLTEVLQPDVYGYDGIELQEAIQHLMIEKGLTLATAESCTGGYLSHLLTSIPGSSAYYQGSIIAYANAVKTNLLNVPNEILKEYGAVSEKTARAMALGCIERLGVDIAIAITGVAGPDGGTEDKPVGMVWIAVGTKEKMKSHVFQLQKNRLLNIKFATTLSLIMLRKLLVNV